MVKTGTRLQSQVDDTEVIVVRTAAATGYAPWDSRSARAAAAVVMRSPASKLRHTASLVAVAGGVHGRSALSVEPITVSGLPLTVIRAPSTGRTDLTWLNLRSLARSAVVTAPGPAAIRSGTTRRGTLEAGAAAVRGTGGAGLAAATEPAIATAAAASAPATVAGRDVRRTLRSLTVT